MSDQNSSQFFNKSSQVPYCDFGKKIPLNISEQAYYDAHILPFYYENPKCAGPVRPRVSNYISKTTEPEGAWTTEVKAPLLEYRKLFSGTFKTYLKDVQLLSEQLRENSHRVPTSDWIRSLGDYFAASLLNLPKEQIAEMSKKTGCNTSAQQDAIRRINELLTLLLKQGLQTHPFLDMENSKKYCALIEPLYSIIHLDRKMNGCLFVNYSNLITLNAEMFGELLDHPDIKDDPVACMLAGILFLEEGVSNHPECLEIPAEKLIMLLENLKRKRNSDAATFVFQFLKENSSVNGNSECRRFVPSEKQLQTLSNCMQHPEGVRSGDLQKMFPEISKSVFRKTVMDPLIQAKLLELTNKNKVSSPHQRNVLTEQGKAVLKASGAVCSVIHPDEAVPSSIPTVSEPKQNRTM